MKQIFKFVNEIEKHPVLYGYRMEDYSNQDVSDRAWNEVAKEVKLTVNECMEKWKDIRTLFASYIKPSSSVTKNEKHYLTDAMKLTLPFIKLLDKPIKPTSKITQKSSYLRQNMSDLAEKEKYSQSVYPKVNLRPLPSLLPLHSTQSLITLPQGKMVGDTPYSHATQKFEKKLKRTNSDKGEAYAECLNKKIKNVKLTSNIGNQRKVMFLLSLIPEIKPLTVAQMKLFRRKFLQVIDDITRPTPQSNSLPSTSQQSSTHSHFSSQSSLSIQLGPDDQFQNFPSDDQMSINTQELYYDVAREVMDEILENELLL